MAPGQVRTNPSSEQTAQEAVWPALHLHRLKEKGHGLSNLHTGTACASGSPGSSTPVKCALRLVSQSVHSSVSDFLQYPLQKFTASKRALTC